MTSRGHVCARVLLALGAVVVGWGWGRELPAQVPPDPPPPVVDEVPVPVVPPSTVPDVPETAVLGLEPPISPAGAFARSLLVPGWGHVATGSFARGGFYVAAQTGSLWMVWKSSEGRRQANSFLRLERSVVEGRLRRVGVTDPDSLRLAVEADPGVERWNELVDVRGQQVEDWVALSVFLVLLGAVDAFVAAHLMDFPEPLSFEVLPRWTDRGVDLGLRIPIPNGIHRTPGR